MKPPRTPLPRLSVVALALATAAATARADDPRPSPVVLFDGKTLGGWKAMEPGEAGAKVEGGLLLIDAGTPMNGITTTRTDLPRSDYELTYEAMRRSGGDFFAAATFPVGDSFITLVNGGWGNTVTGLSSLDGADASENETTQFVDYKNGTWYRFRVRVTATTIRAWVDDREVVAVNHEGRKVGTRLETRANQPLGFATYESAGALRKVEVRKLTPAEVAATHKPEE